MTPDGMPATARMLITIEPDRRALIVRTSGTRPRWGLPGGVVEAGEAPSAAAEREVREETGLIVTAGVPLLVEWIAPRTPVRRGRLAFTFAGPTLSAADARIVLPPTEVDAYEWIDRPRAAELFHPLIVEQVGHGVALPAYPTYLETHPSETTS